MRRRMINTAKKMALLARDETAGLDGQLEQAENLVYGLRGQTLSGGLEPPKQHARTFIDTLEKRHANQGELDGLPTGYMDLDRMLGGLSPKQFYCLAGRPGMGKTSLLLAICDHIARLQKKKVALFTLEMDIEQINRRIVAKETRIDTMRLRRGDVYDHEWGDVHRMAGELSESGLHIDETPGITPSQIRAKTRRMKSEYGLDLIVIDHLHLMVADRPTGNNVEDITDISRSLAFLGKDLGVPILAAAQLSRAVEQRSDKRPLLSDLRGSGGIEENAFCVMFIYRDEYYNPDTTERPNIGEINIAKHRDGPTGVIDLYWHGQLATFRNLQRQEIVL
jgi:replicative DNA helicase